MLPYALYGAGRFAKSGLAQPDYPIEEFLRASISIERQAAVPTPDSAAHDAALAGRFTVGVSEVVRRLTAEPEVAAVTFARSYPGHEAYSGSLEVEGAGARGGGWVNQVDVDLFSVFDVPILAGRGFVESDAVRGSNAVIVDRMFAEHVLGGGSVLGRRVREFERGASGEEVPGPWLEIVGVVPAFSPPPPFQPVAPKLYQPLALVDAAEPIHLAVRLRRGVAPATVPGRVREITRSVDPALRFGELQIASEAERLSRKSLLALALAVVAVTGSVLLLSAAGIYAMMSFTVATRRREIGIRVALGASPRRVLSGIFRRAIAQLGAGVLIGLLLAEAVPRVQGGSFFAGEGALMLLVVAVVMLAVGLLAALGPARRGLAVQPTEALSEE